jgi:hypothetical protein
MARSFQIKVLKLLQNRLVPSHEREPAVGGVIEEAVNRRRGEQGLPVRGVFLIDDPRGGGGQAHGLVVIVSPDNRAVEMRALPEENRNGQQ